MPYKSTKDLPKNLRDRLPAGAESAYMSAFNKAKDKNWSESRCHAYAWGAVKKNYKKDGDRWVKKAMTEKQEEAMLRTANRLRRLVIADFMEKTANPAIAGLARALMPALRSLGPKVLGMLKNVPPEAWAQIVPALVSNMAPQGAAGANQRGASSDKKDDKPWEEDDEDREEDDAEDKEAILPALGGLAMSLAPAAISMMSGGDDKNQTTQAQMKYIASCLNKHGVENAATLARAFVLASVETGNRHRKNSIPDVQEALRLAAKMRSELETIQEFM